MSLPSSPSIVTSIAPAARHSEAQEAFASFDCDRDGKITSAEFAKIVRALGHAPTEGELSALVRTVDRIYGGCEFFPLLFHKQNSRLHIQYT